jgi:hypothetical protein
MTATESRAPAYTVTEAARLARVSVQALRQRIQRGTLRTTRMVRDRRIVAGVPRDELVRAYPELAEAAEADLERLLHGEDPAERERLQDLEQSSSRLESERDKARRAILVLRKRLAAEREVRARLEGVVEDQERRLEELSTERSRLERRVVELDNRVVFLDGGQEDLPPSPEWWRSGVVWARVAVAAVVVTTFAFAGGAYWRNMEARLDAQTRKLFASIQSGELRAESLGPAGGEESGPSANDSADAKK